MDRLRSPALLVFVIGADAELRVALVCVLQDRGYAVAAFGDDRAALAAAARHRPAAIVIDHRGPEQPAHARARRLRRGAPGVPLVALAGADAAPTARFDAVLRRPIEPAPLDAALRALATPRARRAQLRG